MHFTSMRHVELNADICNMSSLSVPVCHYNYSFACKGIRHSPSRFVVYPNARELVPFSTVPDAFCRGELFLSWMQEQHNILCLFAKMPTGGGVKCGRLPAITIPSKHVSSGSELASL